MSPTSCHCPVCRASATTPLVDIDGRAYWRCGECQARFLAPQHYLPPAAELAHYQQHHNAVYDPGYRAFLARLAAPLLLRLPAARQGLDYGCGPGPALAAMLREAGHAVALYDPFFAPDPAPLQERYDFITCSEAAEHFHDAASEFEKLHELLKPGGWLALMTCFQTDDERFANWHYRRDPTHVVFYREATMQWLARRFSWECVIPSKDVALMRKPER